MPAHAAIIVIEGFVLDVRLWDQSRSDVTLDRPIQLI